jgi:predicted aspartyl protease
LKLSFNTTCRFIPAHRSKRNDQIYESVSVFVLIGIITSGVAFARTIRKEVTFGEVVAVNGAVVKKGSYNVMFDDQTNEVTMSKGRRVMAKAPAQLEPRDRDHSIYVTRAEDGDPTR